MTRVPSGKKFQKDKIAVIYAVGGIDGNSRNDIISEKLVETIDDVSKAKDVKAVVLRVSSPGGSAYGSEQIWRALSNLKKEKPLIVSWVITQLPAVIIFPAWRTIVTTQALQALSASLV